MSRRLYGNPGERYGNLIVISEAPGLGKKRRVRCRCNCGNETTVRLTHIRSGTIKGCGCGMWRPKHGMTKSPEYKSWLHMKDRCLNKDNKYYSSYGGRGITVHPEWVDNFQSFYDHIGPRPHPSSSVDRIDNNKGYVPGNVRWASHIQQVRNTRQNRMIEWNGEVKTLGAWAEELAMSSRTLQTRLSRGWTVDRALGTPIRQQKSRRGGLVAGGRMMSLPEWEATTGIPFKTILMRVDELGWSPEDAVSLPIRGGKNC